MNIQDTQQPKMKQMSMTLKLKSKKKNLTEKLTLQIETMILYILHKRTLLNSKYTVIKSHPNYLRKRKRGSTTEIKRSRSRNITSNNQHAVIVRIEIPIETIRCNYYKELRNQTKHAIIRQKKIHVSFKIRNWLNERIFCTLNEIELLKSLMFII